MLKLNFNAWNKVGGYGRYLNTSHVKVKLVEREMLKPFDEFKYISC